MKIAAILFLFAAVPLAIFSVWGLFTSAGQHRYDEMHALYPALGGMVAIVCALASFAFNFFSRGVA